MFLAILPAAVSHTASVTWSPEREASEWQVECVEGVCRASQSLKSQESGQLLATLIFVLETDEAAGGFILDMPLGVGLRPGVRVPCVPIRVGP